ncbi:MAG: L-seryl-tRNA(Sec) selenium transferase, partial [Anaerolineae bacterium]
MPSVDKLLARADVAPLIEAHGRPLTTDAIRAAIDTARAAIRDGGSPLDESGLVERASNLLREWMRPRPRPVVNATGVIIHTNLGRAPLSKAALEAVQAAAVGYSDLEYDLAMGERGHRMAAVEDILCRVTGAEAALVVNNNAGAVLLTLSAIAKDKGVLISRGQLVEIGGGFRVPDVMAQSGARLIEVGTTNRTHRRDYEMALVTASGEVAAILRAHSSNFRVIGFTTEVPLNELVEIGEWKGIPVIDDLGSGSLLDTARYGLMHEPMVQESIAAGAGLMCFSGDKLLGGPQAGIIAGRRDFVDRARRNAMFRALRVDKLTIAALEATLLAYLREDYDAIPALRMIRATQEQTAARATSFADKLRAALPAGA